MADFLEAPAAHTPGSVNSDRGVPEIREKPAARSGGDTARFLTHATDEDGWSRHPSQRAFKAYCGQTVEGRAIGYPPTCERCAQLWDERQLVEI